MIIAINLLFFVASTGAAADSLSKDTAKDKLDLKILQMRIEEMLRHNNEMPDARPIVTIVGKPTWSSLSTRRWLLSSIELQFDGIRNRYCRLAITNSATGETDLVSLPERALHDTCSRLDSIFYGDIDGDGDEDVIHGVTVKSNRSYANMVEPIVYLSQGSSSIGYCYSADASAQLAPIDLKSSAGAFLKLRSAQQRLNLEKFACSTLP